MTPLQDIVDKYDFIESVDEEGTVILCFDSMDEAMEMLFFLDKSVLEVAKSFMDKKEERRPPYIIYGGAQ